MLIRGKWYANLRKMMFFGKYPLLLSEKRQFILPSIFLNEMRNTAYIVQGFDQNLLLLTQQAFTAIYTQIKGTSISDPLARLLKRLFLGGIAEVEINNLGQIELPFNLYEYAGLGKEIILVGQGDYLEIWSPALWQQQMESLSDFDVNTHRFEKFHVSLT
jgi:MraZ protein